MKRTFLLLFLGWNYFLHSQSLPNPYPFLYHVTVSCRTAYSAESKFYYYGFVVANDTNNKGTILFIDLDISRAQNSVAYDTVGLPFCSRLTEIYFRRHYPRLMNQIVPVGFPAFPGRGWFANIGGDYSEATICSDTLGITPGRKISNIVLASKALPGIRKVRFEPEFHDEYYFPPDDTTNTDDIDSIRQAIKFSGWTVGPTAPPIIFEAASWCDTLARYSTQSLSLGWIKDQVTADKYLGYLSSARTKLVQSDSVGASTILQQVLRNVDIDSTANLSSEAYALLKFNTEYLANKLPRPHGAPSFVIKLINSTGANVTGGSLQYYDGTWKDATNYNDGTFSIATSLKTLSLRMTYEYGTQTKSNVTVGPDVVFFQTVRTQVKLQSSQGVLMDTGSVQYYAGAWRNFGTTASGVATKELLPGSYSIRMTYAGGSNDKQQDIGSNPVVVFQTTSASVQLKNSLGALMDQGSVQYYAGTWRNFGVTTNGAVTKELLPNSYSFRMTYAYGSKDLQQNIGTNPVVVFQTVNATAQLKNSLGALIDQGTVQYYAGVWRTFGTTSGGSVSKELLPISYNFRMTNEGVSNDKTQDVSTNSTVSFATVLCTVSVKNSQSQPVNNAMISYYSGAWKQIGPTVSGQITKELLPANLTFRVTVGTVSQDKVQNIGTSSLVEFVTQ